MPDLAVFDRKSMVERDGHVHSAPQLLVEVLSPANTRREREEKLADYAEIGVPEVWVISPEPRTVEVLYLEDRYRGARTFSTAAGSYPQALPPRERRYRRDLAGVE